MRPFFMSYIQGEDRGQAALLPVAIEDYVAADAPVRVIDAFVDGLLAALSPKIRSEKLCRNSVALASQVRRRLRRQGPAQQHPSAFDRVRRALRI
jgi:hypothetical protein